MEKPAYIEAVYNAFLYYEVEDIEKELGIRWENVEKYWIKYRKLIIRTKDGKEHVYIKKDGSHVNLGEFKRPDRLNLLDEDYWKIEQ